MMCSAFYKFKRYADRVSYIISISMLTSYLNFNAYLCIRHISDVSVWVWFKFHSKVGFPFNIPLFKYVFPNLVSQCAPYHHPYLLNIFSLIRYFNCTVLEFASRNLIEYTSFLAIYKILYFISTVLELW